MKKNRIILLCCFLMIAGLVLGKCAIDKFYNKNTERFITEADAGKAIALLFFSNEECRANQNDYFGSGEDKQWYEDYINMLITGKPEITFFKPDHRRMNSVFTYKELNELLKELGMESINSISGNHKLNDAVKRTDWYDIYEAIVQKHPEVTDVNKCQLTIAGIGDTVVTDLGNYEYSGADITSCMDTRVDAYVRGQVIITLGEIVDKRVVYNNVWIEESHDEKVKVFFCGQSRELGVKGYHGDYHDAVADVVIENHVITGISVKADKISGKVLEISDNTVEIESFGTLEITDDFRVYNITSGVRDDTKNSILVGYSAQTFIVADGKICCAVIDKKVEADNIRVLISDNGFEDIFHDTVSFTCTTGYTILYGNNMENKAAGEIIEVDKSSPYLAEGRMKITPEENGKVQLLSIERGYGNPAYRGTVEISNTSPSGMMIVNELSLEEYLYAVVPSEMPVSYGVEALKVQAVCARSYAYRHLLSNSCSEYGAHVDDSTRYQVYNNSEETPESIEAVDETYGEVMTYDGETVLAYFFSTSCGVTTTSAIWGGEGLPYIRGKILNVNGEFPDLTDESRFDEFIRSDADTFDRDFAWYRWNCHMTYDEITESVDRTLQSIYSASPECVLTLNSEGEYVSVPIGSVGTVERLLTGERLEGGVLNELIICGTDATVKVKRELNIRKVLNPYGIDINKKDGSVADSMSMLPSAYFVVDDVEDGVVLRGGGYGHGAGMSQNAVKKMSETMSFTEILHFFYTGVEINGIYKTE